MIPHSKPTIGKPEVSAVSSILGSGKIAQYRVVEEFEKSFKQYIGARYAVATNSGTSALHLALLALGVSNEHEVIIPSYVCTALVNAILYTSAKPIIVDVNEEDYNISLSDTKNKITRKSKAIIAPHMFGLPVDLDPFLNLGCPVIEDCALSVGALYKGKKLGSFGHISIFSFYSTKVLTTGEGGMVLTNSKKFYEKMRDLRNYDGKKKFRIRYNYKMTDFQAAMGIEQLKKLPNFIRKRREIAALYNEAFKDMDFECPKVFNTRVNIFYRYIIRVKGNLIHYLKKLKKAGISCEQPVSQPLHRYLGLKKLNFSNTEKILKTALSIPIYPALTKKEIEYITSTVREVFS